MKRVNELSSEIIARGSLALALFLRDGTAGWIEPVRPARTICALSFAGVNSSGPPFVETAAKLTQLQHRDGGWSDSEETAWATAAIRLFRGQDDFTVQAAIQWLRGIRRPSGGWGRHPRDQARIPTTALVSALVPEVVRLEDTAWLAGEWQQDFDSPVRLSYKAGFYLLATTQGQEDQLVAETISHLARDQNDDGGFAPWRGHPIGSDPWSTGVVLWGLSRWSDLVDHKVFEKALDWLRASQLPSGYWAYHYLDDGTSLALIGAVAALKALAKGCK